MGNGGSIDCGKNKKNARAGQNRKQNFKRLYTNNKKNLEEKFQSNERLWK